MAAGEQLICYGEERGGVFRFVCMAFGGSSSGFRCIGHAGHVEGWCKMVFLQAFEHVTEVHVEGLQVKVGSDEIGHLVIIVAFVDIEKLLVIRRGDDENYTGSTFP